MKIIIPIAPRTKKNHSRVVMRGKYPKVLPSEQFEEFQEDCFPYLYQYRGLKIDYQINLKCTFYQDANRVVDLCGYLQAIQDILVHYEILKDDNIRIVQSVDGSRVFTDKQSPRVEIEIERL